MSQQEIKIVEETPLDRAQPLPFPFNQRTFCRYEPIEKRIEEARVLVVDNLLRDEGDTSEVARKELGRYLSSQIRREREIANLAVENILSNIERLVKRPTTRVVHVSELAQAEREFRPDAIVLGGTLRDFDYYNPAILASFTEFIRNTRTPVLASAAGISWSVWLLTRAF